MSANSRLGALAAQVGLPTPSSSGRSALLQKSPDDIVVTCALRTAHTKGGRGGFKDTPASDLLSGILSGVLLRSGIPAHLVEDIVVGSVLPPGGGATEFRAAAIVAGFPVSTAVRATNRQCSSGLQAVVDIANAIRAGSIDVGVGAGVESMSLQYGPGAVTEFSPLMNSVPKAKQCTVPMGKLSEDMAQDRKISRAAQDAFAAASYQKALQAQKDGKFVDEIYPLTVDVEDADGKTTKLVVDRDDGIRDGITAESLAKIKPAFNKTTGTIHAGNASQISDGAAAVLLMRRSTAERLGQKILGKYVQSACVGVEPLLMGVGPWAAIPKVFEKTGINKDDVDVFEINEAFASQCVWCVNELGIDVKKVNPNGGAIAFGHPLGATGARQVATLLNELRRTGGKVGVTSMCVGTGMGYAAVWVAE
ncbi:Thiolase, N-terminal domain-containing protein [Peziza echinospora]|nr:Thiolase, N-terminal domain-containing protein [Peziza echinospora]